MTTGLLLLAVVWLAYSNGANDNFKGVATLYGSGTASFRRALAWATVCTLAGSLFSALLAGRLVEVFSGAGLVPDHLLGSVPFLAIVGGSAAAAVYLATLLGMPTSTTHALAGALLGVAWASAALANPWPSFLHLFAAALLVSPLLAIGLTALAYPLMRRLCTVLGVRGDSCVCLEKEETVPAPNTAASVALGAVGIHVDSTSQCRQRYDGSLPGTDAQATANVLHYLSAGAVCFSRAVNDTPKIAALLLAAGGLHARLGLGLVSLAVVGGGLLQSRRVAETMSRRITELDYGQGLTANLVTAGLVLFGSWWGMPMSTTHVSCGSICGIGLAQRRMHWRTVSAVLATWVTTLPLAAALAALLFRLTF